MFSFIFVIHIACGLFNQSGSVQCFLSLLITILLLEIQLWRGEGWLFALFMCVELLTMHCLNFFIIWKEYIASTMGSFTCICVLSVMLNSFLCSFTSIFDLTLFVFNATFSNISTILWQPVLVIEEAGVPGENHRPWAGN